MPADALVGPRGCRQTGRHCEATASLREPLLCFARKNGRCGIDSGPRLLALAGGDADRLVDRPVDEPVQAGLRHLLQHGHAVPDPRHVRRVVHVGVHAGRVRADALHRAELPRAHAQAVRPRVALPRRAQPAGRPHRVDRILRWRRRREAHRGRAVRGPSLGTAHADSQH